MTRFPRTPGGFLELDAISQSKHIFEDILAGDGGNVQGAIRALFTSVPQLMELDTQELAVLAKLHMRSADSQLQAMKLLLPDVFDGAANTPNPTRFLQLEGPRLQFASDMIDLQTFHLLRASQLVSGARRLLSAASKPVLTQQQQQ